MAVRSSKVSGAIRRSTTGSQVTGRPLDFLSPRDSSCPLTKNELRQMDELLSSFNDTVRNDRLRCDNLDHDREPLIVSLSADRCSELKESILSNVNDLKMVFQCLKVTGDKDDDVYKTLKTTYEMKVRQLQQQVDSAKKQFETKFNQEINRLKKHLQEIEKEMRVTLEELGKERLARQEANTKLILEYLENGKIESACSTFKDKLNVEHSRTNINAIVKIAIGKELGTNISMENVVIFTQGLTDDAEAMAHGAIRLFQILEHQQALDVPTVHILHGAVGNIIGSCKSLEGTDFETLKLILDEETVDLVIQVFNKLEFLINI
jgi:F0F1-type ATP synthase membrane subunit b/b'